MSDYFLLDPDYKDFPEKQKLKFLTVYGEQHTFIVLAVLMFIFYSFVTLIIVFNAFPSEWPYFSYSEQTQGVVTVSCQLSRRSFTYSFEATDAEGKSHFYTGEADQYKNAPCPKVGDHLTIEYLPDQPMSSARYMPEGTSSSFNICATGFMAIFSIGAVGFGFRDISAFIQACAKYPKLKQATAILEAKIVAVKDSKKDKIHGRLRGAYCIEVEYEFVINKHLLTGKQLHRRNDLRNNTLPQPGTPVRVLYADENTYVML